MKNLTGRQNGDVSNESRDRCFIPVYRGKKKYHLYTADVKKVFKTEKRSGPVLPGFHERVGHTLSTDADV
jgi:hypothetical protein